MKSDEQQKMENEIRDLQHKIRLLKEKRLDLIRSEAKKRVKSLQQKIKETEDIKKEKIEILDLPTRAENSLKNAGIETIKQLFAKSESDLLQIKGFGRFSLFELRNITHGIDLCCGAYKNH